MKIKCPKCDARLNITPENHNGIVFCELCKNEFIPAESIDINGEVVKWLSLINEQNRDFGLVIVENQQKIISLLEGINNKI